MKTTEEIIKQIKSKKWYYQGAHAKHCYIGGPSDGGLQCMDVTLAFVLLREGKMYEGFFPDEEFLQKATAILEQQKKDGHCINHIIERCDKQIQACDTCYKKLEQKDLHSASFHEVVELLQELEEKNVQLWKEVFIADIFDPHGEALLHQEIKKAGVLLKPSELACLLRPLTLHYAQKERLSMLEMAVQCKTKKLHLTNPLVQTFLKEHASQYFYLENSWAQTKRATKGDFEKRLEELIASPLIKIREQIRDLTYPLEKKQTDIRKKRKISTSLHNVLTLFQQMAFLRDQRKRYTQLNNHWYDELYQRIATITKVPFEELSLAQVRDLDEKKTRQEYLKIFATRQEMIMKLSSGQKIWAVSPEDGKIFYKLLAQGFMHTGESIKGTPACQGIAQGTVKVVMGETHFGKFENGNILVAPMTRPEYVPLMKKAAGIITDEGGITCHAAVIARELKVPCITGTQTATKVLKDGMHVTIDANKGIVTVVERE